MKYKTSMRYTFFKAKLLLRCATKGIGGIFIMDGYKPYNNMLLHSEQEKLKIMYDKAEGGKIKNLGACLSEIRCL